MTAQYTPTEQRMLDLLGDGQPHRREELHACLYDDLSVCSNIQPHLSRIRRKIRPRGLEIVCELLSRRICYRLVRLVVSADE